MTFVEVAEGREALSRWEESRPRNFYDATPNLARVLDVHLGPVAPNLEPRLRAFGEAVALTVEPAVAACERRRGLPALAPRDGVGREREAVEFDPAHEAGARAVWASGILALPPERGAAFQQAALLYLLTHAGEGGYACPVTCTAGLIRALRDHGSAELRERFLPPLLATDATIAQRGAQFLTEVQGGSDVGANTTTAAPDDADPALWRIEGEKWFCSVADADQFVVTARVAGGARGTRGLGCFLVPRLTDDGEPNGFRIRRLKDKLGTRALATGEIDFDGALAYSIGPPEEGFRIAASAVLNTSRWLNAAGCAGLMRRAYLEAAGFSRHRAAFGRAVSSFPLVRENLAVMKTEEYAALASTMELTALVDGIQAGHATAEDVAFHRFLVNANKVETSLAATRVTRRGIEALGGNGTIEDFSPLPRLYRDAIVLESWEGTHNVLCAQVLRDLGRDGAADAVLRRLRGRLSEVDAPDAGTAADVLDDLEPRLRRSLRDPADAGLHSRRQLTTLVRVVQAAAMLREAAGSGDAGEKAAAASFFVRRRLVRGYDPEADAEYPELVERVLAGDADPA